jgi:methanogenic corrinoid protein MtbC1
MGECAPFGKYSLTHGLCQKCDQRGMAEKKSISPGLQALAGFFLKLRRLAREGIESDPEQWVKKGFALGIKPEDLLVGIIQPALYEIGELWSKGEVTVAAEHRFSSFAETVVGHVYRHYPRLGRNRQSRSPDILLANADGNYHTLGAKFLETCLLSAGLKTFTVLPGLPGREILELVKALKPKALGLSVSLHTQVKSLRELAGEIKRLPAGRRPLLLAGGLPIKEGLALPPELSIICCRDIAGFPFEQVRRPA